MKNQIFLPGIDPDTGAYASAMLGPATVLSRTEVDGTGTNYDAERVSESRRDLRQAPELRRMVKYRQGIAIIDTADPILFRFMPRGDTGDVTTPPKRSIDPPNTLAEAVAEMKEIKTAQVAEQESVQNHLSKGKESFESQSALHAQRLNIEAAEDGVLPLGA
jgi:type IV secretory pathway TraG/TraD family ATPase VirD4